MGGDFGLSRAGRPTTDPKTNWIGFRMSDNDIQRMKYCAEKAGITKAETVRRGVEKLYNELSTHTKDETV